jgi:hypothetical protein
MPIIFLETQCETSSSIVEFGLCDDPPPATDPAYIDELDKTKWIAIVENPNLKTAYFYAVDHCVTVVRPDGTTDSRCDGILLYENNLVFVELKSRQSGQWLKKGREQLTNTIRNFMANHDISTYNSVRASVCNNLKPLAHFGQATNIQKFKDDTGYILRGSRRIII